MTRRARWITVVALAILALPRTARPFESSGVRLASHVAIADFELGLNEANEVWGYTAPSGREYAILGFRRGTGFVEVTDPDAAVIVGYVSGGGVDETWRDMAVFQEYAYVVSDGDGVGLQVVDLTRIDEGVVELAATTDLGIGLTEAHNVFVNEDSATLYLALPNVFSGRGLLAVSLESPTAPAFVGRWASGAGVRCHDLQVVSYPTGHLAGREIAFCFAEEDGLKIVDVGDKADIVLLNTVTYPDVTYAHQGWLSEDRRFLFLGDELDEKEPGGPMSTTTYVIDVEFLLSAAFDTSFTNGLPAIDHNMMVRGDLLFEANYTSGLRVYDVSDVHDVTEVGWFDTFPSDDGPLFAGAWGVYAGLPSGTVLVSDIQNGLFVLDVTALPEPDPGLLACIGVGSVATLARRSRHRARGGRVDPCAAP